MGAITRTCRSHQRRIGQRFFQINDGRQPIELDGDVGKRVLGEMARSGRACRQGHCAGTPAPGWCPRS